MTRRCNISAFSTTRKASRPMIRSITLVFTLVVVANVRAEKIKSPIVPGKCLVYFDFAGGNHNLGASGGEVRLNHELKRDLAGGSLHFASDRQYAELDAAGMGELSRRLADVRALSVGGWFQLWRTAEQTLVSRGSIKVGTL